jgi:hypothetical protein
MELAGQLKKWFVQLLLILLRFTLNSLFDILPYKFQIDEAADRYSFMAKMLGASWTE